MGESTNIEWADKTFNPWEGCTKVGPGCDHCYAETRNKRFHGGNWGPGAPRRRTSPANWAKPRRWNTRAAEKGVRYRVFCASLADVFDNEVPTEWRADLFKLISETPHLDWLLLTKRIGNVVRMVTEVAEIPRQGSHSGHLMAHHWRNGRPPANVWLGATVVNQQEADRDIPKLLDTPARLRWLSMEPLLGFVDLESIKQTVAPGFFGDVLHWYHRGHCHQVDGIEYPSIDWVIVGGESGTGARPMHPDWARSLRDQCQAAGVPFLFKQWGEWAPDWEGAETCGNCGKTKFDAINARGECSACGSDSWQRADAPLDTPCRVGKKKAGRLLDGRTWDQFPGGDA